MGKLYRTCSHFIRVLIVILCILGFIWISFEQVQKFFTRATSVSTVLAESQDQTFPSIAFCALNPYKPGASTAYVSQETFDQISVETNVTLDGLLISELDPLRKLNFSEDLIYTIYNGKCKIFEVKGDIMIKQYLMFSYPKDEKYHLFILQPYQKLFMIWQQWMLDIAPNLEVNGDTDMVIELKRFLSLFSLSTSLQR